MIIYSRKKRNINTAVASTKVDENLAIVKEEVKKEEFIPKKKNNKKSIPAPVVDETPAVVEEEEKIDLSEWLKDEIED